ncbi:MAG: NADH-quinone oxidoreductase subunit N [Anaerolineae bacterium]|nr:NADH-quinone oxidoreductase subunit N [Anaerolineae bacterium]MBL8104516.1 NADH-quinone oxidoreductase subunit N [Anaerolineales bacterium]MCC7187156.1 NADH-quinone oxidoreductase subunit N [Anaerolineales bacterium]
MNQSDLTTILPVTILTVWACALLLLDLFIPKTRKGITALLSALGLAVTLGYTIAQIGNEVTGFNGMVTLDGFSIFVNALLLVSGLLGVALAYGYVKRMGIERGEYYTLLLFSVVGMMLMAQATDLIIVFLALELLSIPLYVLAAFTRDKTESEEAGLKYFLLGAFSSGFLVYGIALIFGATHTTNIFAIVTAASSSTGSLLLTIGAALLLIGFGFKVAAVPFHMWTPDVYQGAPTAVTAFMSSGAKIAGFAALLRVFATAFPSIAADMTDVFWVISAATMIVGNVVAIAQTDIKRLLAYSSIAHAGYILMAFVPYGNDKVVATSVAAGLFYLVAYVFTNFGAWGVVIALEKKEGKGLALDDYAGLAKKHPALAAAMAIFMLSLIGLPPTIGLIGKLYLFRAVIDAGFVWLAIIGVLTSLVSAFYYLRVVVIMYMKDGEPATEREPFLDMTTLVTALVTVVVSFVPQFLFAWASDAVLKLF